MLPTNKHDYKVTNTVTKTGDQKQHPAGCCRGNVIMNGQSAAHSL